MLNSSTKTNSVSSAGGKWPGQWAIGCFALATAFLGTNGATLAQYGTGQPTSYSRDKDQPTETSYRVTGSKSSEVDYSHSGVQIGLLSEVGYIDLAYSRLQTRPDGKYRQPVAIEELDESTAIILTKLTGEIYLLDQGDMSLRVVLSDQHRSWTHAVVLRPDLFAAIDAAASQVVFFAQSEAGWRMSTSLDTPGLPAGIAWDPVGNRLYVSGQWSQRLYRFQATDTQLINWEKLPDTDLAFCGGVVTWLPAPQLLMVVDAFGNNFALLANRESDQAMAHSHRAQLYEHNIAAVLPIDQGNRLLMPAQLLNPEAHSIQGEIVWGNVVSNNLRLLRTESLVQGQGASLYQQARLLPLGNAGDGAGDPTSVAINKNSIAAVTLGGTDRVAVGPIDSGIWRKFQVGMRPVDSLFSSDGQRLFVINQFSDSLSVIDLDTEKIEHIQLGPIREFNLAERGERLFFHSSLSHDGWMSCHSCHSRGHSSSGSNDNLTDSTLGTPKRILSLLGQADTSPYGWTGKFTEIESQIVHSLQSTMATDYPVSRDMVDALAAFIRSLPPPPSLWEARKRPSGHELVREGQTLFEQLSCQDCHSGALFTSEGIFDVGLTDEREQALFNPPSLLGVSQRQSALLHDARATSLRDVLERFRHQLPQGLSTNQLDALVAYLQSL